jgi:hypothetical protein
MSLTVYCGSDKFRKIVGFKKRGLINTMKKSGWGGLQTLSKSRRETGNTIHVSMQSNTYTIELCCIATTCFGLYVRLKIEYFEYYSQVPKFIGVTDLQAGRSRVRFPVESLEFFSDLILAVALWPWGRNSL